MGKITFRSSDHLIDDVWGKIGTPGRDRMEAELKRDVDGYFVREAIKKATKEQSVSLSRSIKVPVQA